MTSHGLLHPFSRVQFIGEEPHIIALNLSHAGPENHHYVVNVCMRVQRIDKEDHDVAAIEQDLCRDLYIAALGSCQVSPDGPPLSQRSAGVFDFFTRTASCQDTIKPTKFIFVLNGKIGHALFHLVVGDKCDSLVFESSVKRRVAGTAGYGHFVVCVSVSSCRDRPRAVGFA
jgi:hypothetical protein